MTRIEGENRANAGSALTGRYMLLALAGLVVGYFVFYKGSRNSYTIPEKPLDTGIDCLIKEDTAYCVTFERLATQHLYECIVNMCSNIAMSTCKNDIKQVILRTGQSVFSANTCFFSCLKAVFSEPNTVELSKNDFFAACI